MEIEHLPLDQSRADKCRAAQLKWRGKPPGIPPEMAAEFMEKLKAGSTVRKLTGGGALGPPVVSYDRFKKHCELHPVWAAEAWRVSKKNVLVLKGSHYRDRTHCIHGHPLVGDNLYVFYISPGRPQRKCRACRKVTAAYAPPMADDIADRVKNALEGGASLSQITNGRPVGGGKRNPKLIITSFKIIRRHRRENPDFNQFVVSAISDSVGVGLRVRYGRRRNAAKREQANDYHSIRAMLPANFPDKDDVVGAIFEELLTGALKRENVEGRLRSYIAAHNRMFPTKYSKFGNSPLVSLDEVLFDDGSTTRGDTVSRGLWD
jgi:hypothetical protein